MARFQILNLISIGLKNTLQYLIFRGQNYFENDIFVIYLTKDKTRYSASFTKLLADVTEILTKL